MRVYYLTGAQFAISNIALKRIKISRFRDLNDPFELLGVNLADRTYRKAFRAKRDELDKGHGLICFSRTWKNPLVWGHYAEKHTGVALGFDVSDELLLPIEYADNLADVVVRPISGKPSKKVVDRLIRTKFRDWQYEDELRFFTKLDHKAALGGLYFYSFSKHLALREVILGPRCPLPIAAVRKLVSNFPNKVTVVKARIAFTRFEVLTNKVATRADREA